MAEARAQPSRPLRRADTVPAADSSVDILSVPAQESIKTFFEILSFV